MNDYLVNVEAPMPDEEGDLHGDVLQISAENGSKAAQKALDECRATPGREDWHVSGIAEA